MTIQEYLRSVIASQSTCANAFVGLMGLGLVSCGGSVKANANASTGGEADVNFDAEGDAAWEQVAETTDVSGPSSSEDGPQGADTPEPALLGARHDLLLAQGMDAKCSCLVVVLGKPDHPGLVWTARTPTIDSRSQLIIALGSDGVPCDEPGPGASYMGYAKKGNDIIVSVEATVSGRPVTHGAIIPRPQSGGRILIQGKGNIPYGRSLSGEAPCSVTLPQ